MVYNKHCFSYSVTVFIRHAWSACNRVAVICRAGYVQQICTDPVYSLPGKNDPYFYRKRPLYLPGSEVRKRCEIFSVRSVSNAKKQISTLSVTFLQQKKRIASEPFLTEPVRIVQNGKVGPADYFSHLLSIQCFVIQFRSYGKSKRNRHTLTYTDLHWLTLTYTDLH